MRKLMLFTLLVFSFAGLKAQEDMTVVWESRLEHQINFSELRSKANTATPLPKRK